MLRLTPEKQVKPSVLSRLHTTNKLCLPVKVKKTRKIKAEEKTMKRTKTICILLFNQLTLSDAIVSAPSD
jgi:hypothetical protein